MVVAYVMIKANTGGADRLKSDISALEGVESTHIVAGDVDLISKLDVGNPRQVKDIVASGIQSIDGVETTQTYLSMD
ncbi:MAG: Lrp/AsnC ligand binding domain-containing protein [Halobacteriota archaeon]